jgi:hypothetical protein
LNVNGADLGTWTNSAITGLIYTGVATNPYLDKSVSDARFDNFLVETLPGGGIALMQTNNAAPVLSEKYHFQEKAVNLDK